MIENPITHFKIFNICITKLATEEEHEEEYNEFDVLIIDDDNNTRQILTNMIRNLNCNEIVDVSDLTGIESLNEFDIIIINISKLDTRTIKIVKKCAKNKEYYIIGISPNKNNISEMKLYNLRC